MRAHISDPYFMPKAFQSEKILLDPPAAIPRRRSARRKYETPRDGEYGPLDDGIMVEDVCLSVLQHEEDDCREIVCSGTRDVCVCRVSLVTGTRLREKKISSHS